MRQRSPLHRRLCRDNCCRPTRRPATTTPVVCSVHHHQRPRPCDRHRRNGRWGVTASAFNTGLALARGEVVIFFVDWAYAPPGWIEAHLRHHSGRRAVCVVGPYFYNAVGITEAIYARLVSEFLEFGHTVRPWSAFLQQPKLKLKIPFDLSTQDARTVFASVEADEVLRGEVFDEISVFEEGLFDPAWLPRMPPIPDGDPGGRKYAAGVPVDHAVVHLKNESARRRTIYQLNGIDVWGERGGRMSVDTDFGLRLFATVPFVWEPAAMFYCINPRHGVCRTMPFGDVAVRIEGRWNLEDCVAYQKRRVAEVKRGMVAAPAPYTLTTLAEKLEPWRTAETIDTSKLDVADTEFFGREIWPDSAYEVTP